MPLREIISMVATSSVFQAMTYDSIMDGTYMNVMYSGSYVIFSLLNYALLAAFIIFVVIDIVKINKQNYKTQNGVSNRVYRTLCTADYGRDRVCNDAGI